MTLIDIVEDIVDDSTNTPYIMNLYINNLFSQNLFLGIKNDRIQVAVDPGHQLKLNQLEKIMPATEAIAGFNRFKEYIMPRLELIDFYAQFVNTGDDPR